MDKDIQSSFIPKQVLSKEPVRRREPTSLFLLLSFVVLVIAGLFFGGAYSYQLILQGKIDKLLTSLEVRRQSLVQLSLIEKIERLDKQLKRAVTLLDGHRTLLAVFKFLEDETLQSIRYSSFSQIGSSVTLRGLARNYEGVALQSIIFADDERVTDFVFSDLNVDATGHVSFNLKLDLDPSLFSYGNYLASSLLGS